MRITLLALGSRGDVQPFAPLGAALQARGHRVRVASFAAHARLFDHTGIDYHVIGGDAQELVTQAADGLLTGTLNPFTAFLALRRSFAELADQIGRDLSAPVLRDSDLIINQLPGGLYGADLAEHLHIPCVAVGVLPLSQTRAWPMLAFPRWPARLPGYNRLSYRIAEGLVWILFGGAINRWRTHTLGLRSLPAADPFRARRRSPMVYGFSRHVIARPADWGDPIAITGWWLPRWPGWTPPDRLRRFVEDGQAPIYIGFGSMPVRDRERLTAMLVEGVRRSGRRAVLNAGWAGLGGTLPPEMLAIDEAPFDWLFPRVSAVIHHGGSGTVGYGLTCGRPTQIVAFGFDQFFWGERIQSLGVGPAPIAIHHLTPAALAGAIDHLVSDPAQRERATALGRKLSAEDGIAAAVTAIEHFAGSPGSA